MEVKWIKVTDQLPEPDKEYLIWTGTCMLVSYAEFYLEEDYEHIPAEFHDSLKRSKGYFREFGQKYYFDDERVQYTELPRPPRGE